MGTLCVPLGVLKRRTAITLCILLIRRDRDHPRPPLNQPSVNLMLFIFGHEDRERKGGFGRERFSIYYLVVYDQRKKKEEGGRGGVVKWKGFPEDIMSWKGWGS